MIRDSGNRKEYETGAVRDIQDGKGRCDLLPLDVVAQLLIYDYEDNDAARIMNLLSEYRITKSVQHLRDILITFTFDFAFPDMCTALLEVSKHFEEGAKKYGEYNWQKGIPEESYIDSAVRHFLKWLRGDEDERHDRAFMWNIMCLIWTHQHITEPDAEQVG